MVQAVKFSKPVYNSCSALSAT